MGVVGLTDPNGPMIYKGIYHLFYQYNPFGAVWGNIVWAHATSVDLVNWVHHDHAIYPSKPFDINGCWSGSTTILPGEKPVILYTGVDREKRQVQNLAVPKNLSDIFLREWIKKPQNPLMAPTAINGINASSFRDPTTAWKGPDGRWRVLVGSKRRSRGLAILYRSKDFVHWIKSKHPIHSARKTGMWECPDFFPVSLNSKNGVNTSVISSRVKYVLKLSLDDTKHDYYTVGKYFPDKDKYIPDMGSVDNDSGLRYDYGKFYASKTFFDSVKNRRTLWGWINESDSVIDDIKKGWAGIQAVPRSLWLDKNRKQLVQWPIMEIEKLRKNQVNFPSTELKLGSVVEVSGVTASQADVEVSFELKKLEKAEIMDPSWVNPQLLCSKKGASVKGSFGPFGLLVLASKNLEEQTAIFFRVFKAHNRYVVLMCSDQSRSSLSQGLDKTTYGAFVDVDPLHEKLSLRTLIDHSVVESFGGEGKACMSARVYPKLAVDNEAHLYVFNNGTESTRISKFHAWTMKKAEIN
ncbi:Glycoside hydrolase [Macleaya cordata]|uniref:Glycoside hydrolase n=1 Tax=Macleaya cordata TaxID=56857 RepID=A0A200QCE0_MACCD|nr:Glycoside hydrolase [Macleaya cordata]